MLGHQLSKKKSEHCYAIKRNKLPQAHGQITLSDRLEFDVLQNELCLPWFGLDHNSPRENRKSDIPLIPSLLC